uniref:Ig-like domain-containing protein n=1 Tax=Hucho hucho TaxID=62062 RepID=A0A4W5MSG9_9TELE
MLDDVQLGYYDSNSWRFISRTDGNIDEEYERAAQGASWDVYLSMRKRSSLLQHRFNSTTGIFVHQRRIGCELVDNEKQGQLMIKEAFNGIDAGVLNFNKLQYNYHPKWPELEFNQQRTQYVQMCLDKVYLPICIKSLKDFLKKEKLVMRKVRPRVRLISKESTDSERANITCLAFGFYPRHINLTLLRDGQPVAAHELKGGQLLPNGDWTYQLRKSLTITVQELRERHNYTCTANHISMDNKLDVSWYPDTVPVVLILIGSLVVFGMWKWKHAGFPPFSGQIYSVAKDTET